MSRRPYTQRAAMEMPSPADLKAIITDPEKGAVTVEWADKLGESLKQENLSTSQIRALFGEVRQIQAQWQVGTANRQRALRRLILLKPKMAYRAKRERGNAVQSLRDVLEPALDYVVAAKPRPESAPRGSADNQDDNFERFVEFFEAILAYHKAYGGK